MSNELESSSMSVASEEPAASTASNSAIARCADAYQQARKASLAKNTSRFSAHEAGVEAYKRAFPPLRGSENIRDFVACVARGILLRIFDDRVASRLLAAARTAQSFLRTSPDESFPVPHCPVDASNKPLDASSAMWTPESKKMALIYSPFIRFFNHILLTNKRIHKIASPDSAQSVVHCTADYAIQDPLPAFCGCKPHQHR